MSCMVMHYIEILYDFHFGICYAKMIMPEPYPNHNPQQVS